MNPQHQSIYVTLRYGDATAAIEWLQSTLGFRKHAIHKGEDGAIDHAQLAFGTNLIMLGSRNAGTPQTVYLADPHAEGLFERAVAAGAEVTRPIADTDYGSREFSVRDPEGNTWAVGTYQPQA
jgi:uncharacterized glyoxalase superfamily protein PhnB